MLTFGPIALAAAVARTATTLGASPRFLSSLKSSVLAQFEYLVADSAIFELTPDILYLADSERTTFSGRCGAGVTDLYMNALGYVWRDNAASLASTLDPRADFIYEGGNVAGHGVVLAEARGSFAANASASTISNFAENKYLRQVKRYINEVLPSGERIVHGYSVAFGSKPGMPGSFLGVSETRISKPRKPSPPLGTPSAGGGVSTRLALATHRSNFLLIGAPEVMDWIDWISGTGERPAYTEPTTFVRFDYAGRTYFSGVNLFRRALFPGWAEVPWGEVWERLGPSFWLREAGSFGFPSYLFAMEATAFKSFLSSLTLMIRGAGDGLPDRLELPTLDPVGFGIGESDRRVVGAGRDYNYALFRDGLGLLGSPLRGLKWDSIRWSPKEGIEGAQY